MGTKDRGSRRTKRLAETSLNDERLDKRAIVSVGEGMEHPTTARARGR